ncbi:MAG: hypothetical protein EOP38_15455 [Rubrivivax sp.]|nr:MAG: hypothetical protein EOP38_15455 [Rubrivivax sp.]
MRPRGEVRAALSGAALAWAREQQQAQPDQVKGVTWRQLAELACVGYAAARATVKNMVNAGELLPSGEMPVPGSRRPMATYLPANMQPPAAAGLDDVLHGWGRG